MNTYFVTYMTKSGKCSRVEHRAVSIGMARMAFEDAGYTVLCVAPHLFNAVKEVMYCA